jgi:hypothetical protein
VRAIRRRRSEGKLPLRGSGFLALWNDFDPAREAEYECWHTFEHVPERVGIPGFLSGRRYRAAERSESQYFTLYELESLAALGGPDYVEVVDHPTAWSTANPSLPSVDREAYVLLVEGTSRVSLEAAEPLVRATLLPSGGQAEDASWAAFDLAFSFDRLDIRAGDGRQPPSRAHCLR